MKHTNHNKNFPHSHLVVAVHTLSCTCFHTTPGHRSTVTRCSYISHITARSRQVFYTTVRIALPDEPPQVSHTTATAMTGRRECDATPPPAKCQSSRDASSPKGNRLPYARRLPHVAHLRRSSRDATARAVMPWAGSPLYEEAPLTCAPACRSKDLPRSRDAFEGSISLWQTHSPQSR